MVELGSPGPGRRGCRRRWLVAQRRHLSAVRAQLRRRERRRDRRSGRRARAPALPGRARHRRDLVQPVVPVADVGRGLRHLRLPGHRPGFGTLAEADAVIAEAHALGIRIIIDIVPNHGSDQHPWFLAALEAAPGSAERDRFWFRPGRGPAGDLPPNGWQSIFGGPAWTRVPLGGRLSRGVVPASVRARAAGFQLGEPGGPRRVRGRAAVLVRSRRGRHQDRLRGAAQQGRVAARGGAGPAARPRASLCRPRRRARDLPVLARAGRRLPGPGAHRRDLASGRCPAGQVRGPGRAGHRVQLPLPELPVGRRAAARGHRRHAGPGRAGHLGALQPRR